MVQNLRTHINLPALVNSIRIALYTKHDIDMFKASVTGQHRGQGRGCDHHSSSGPHGVSANCSAEELHPAVAGMGDSSLFHTW